MIETVVDDFLNDRLSAPVYTEIPKEPPDNFFAFEKTSGTQVNHICSSTFAIKSYGKSLYEVVVMNEELRHVMLYELIEAPEIASVSLNTDYNFTDAAAKKYRYQGVYDITHY